MRRWRPAGFAVDELAGGGRRLVPQQPRQSGGRLGTNGYRAGSERVDARRRQRGRRKAGGRYWPVAKTDKKKTRQAPEGRHRRVPASTRMSPLWGSFLLICVWSKGGRT